MHKKYNIYFDILTILSCLMVVFFHMNQIVYQYSDTVSWKISVAERCIVYSAIPIFFMLSGAKLLSYRNRYSTKQYIKKRLLRVGIPFLFWNIFCTIYHFLLGLEPSADSVREFISMFFNASFQAPYWFFYPLFAIYAAIPVLSLILQVPNHRKYLWYTVGISFILNWVCIPLCQIIGIQYNSYFIMPICGGYMMYTVAGYLISTEQWSRPKRWLLYTAALLSGIFAFFYTATSSAANNETNRFIFSYNYFPSALTGAAIFVFIKHLFENPCRSKHLQQDGKFTKLIRSISNCCMGVWLTHYLAIQVLGYFTGLSPANYIWRFACPFLVFSVCLIGTFIAKKLPLFKHIV